MSQWQPIDTVPHDGTPVLVWMPKKHLLSHVHVGMFSPNVSWVGGCFVFDLPSQPTHWMLPPEGPEGEAP
jgi:hypothetical protein